LKRYGSPEGKDIGSNNADAARGKSLNARVKYQERLEARRIKAPFVDIKQPEISFIIDNGMEELIALRVKDYSIAFEDMLLENVNFEIKATDKVALIGSNGTGKTTLLRDIYKNNHNSIEVNDDVKVAYLSQIQGEMIDENNTILEEFFDAGFKLYEAIRLYVSNYGFDEEVLNQKIGYLSGGEKKLLQLAKVAATKSNMLLLDEPTSHLDTYSQIALEKALESYTGAILMISHDYYTIANCMDYVLIIENNTIRRMSTRKFRKWIYASYFDKEYLVKEQKKKTIETKIELALKNNNFEVARVLSEELDEIIKLL
jgi:ATPase components of ABC transporters with duplicated ATPase domains